MKYSTILLTAGVTLGILASCNQEKSDDPIFLNPENRVGLWLSPDKKDTLEFVDQSVLIRRGDFYQYQEYLYRIDQNTLFIKLPDSSIETKHVIKSGDQQSVVLGNMYITNGIAENSGIFLKEDQH